MPVTDRTIKQGQLAELSEQLRRLENRATGILSNIRLEAYPSPLASPFDLDAAKLSDFTREFVQVSREGREIRAAIEKLKDELGLR